MRKKIYLYLLLLNFIFLYPNRGSSYPFISGDTFREYCNHRFDETNKYIAIGQIKNGDTIFLKSDAPYIQDFFTNYYPKIQASFIIVSHNGDHSIPSLKTSMDAPPKDFNLLPYLNDPYSKIIVWFAQNVDIKHPKLKPIPIGLANRCWPHGNVENFKRAIDHMVKWEEKNDLVYLNFDVGTNRAVREPILSYFSQLSFCSNDRKRPHQEYLFEMKKYKFVLCPPGNGRDCHRIWEVLLLGSVPIVEHSILDDLYKDLPIILVYDWKTVTPEFLFGKINEFKSIPMSMEKMYFDYWTHTINSYKPL